MLDLIPEFYEKKIKEKLKVENLGLVFMYIAMGEIMWLIWTNIPDIVVHFFEAFGMLGLGIFMLLLLPASLMFSFFSIALFMIPVSFVTGKLTTHKGFKDILETIVLAILAVLLFIIIRR